MHVGEFLELFWFALPFPKSIGAKAACLLIADCERGWVLLAVGGYPISIPTIAVAFEVQFLEARVLLPCCYALVWSEKISKYRTLRKGGKLLCF